GYPKYVAEYYAARAPGDSLKNLARIITRQSSFSGPGSRFQTMMNSLAEEDPMESAAKWFGAFGSAERKALLQPDIESSLPELHSFARQLNQQQSSSSTLRLLQIQDHAHWLPANLLLRSDRVTM